MCACIDFDNGLAHTIYAASDIFLMPSIFEPCGLSQLISMTYGSVPVVRETGGLKDSVIPYNEYTGEGNGFSFANINAHEFLFVTKYACDLYRHHKDVWKKLIEEGMSGDYSWKKSAREYIGLYSLISGITYEDSQPEIDKKSSVNPKILEIKTKELKNPTPSKIAAPPMAKPDSSKKKTSKVTRISKNKADSSAKVEKKEEKAVVDKKATANKPTPSKAAPKKESKKDNKRK